VPRSAQNWTFDGHRQRGCQHPDLEIYRLKHHYKESRNPCFDVIFIQVKRMRVLITPLAIALRCFRISKLTYTHFIVGEGTREK
jgi:hypothetical protein